MHIIHVIPLSKTLPKEELTYWSPHEIRVGSLLLVPLRKKDVPALVIKTEPAEDLKSQIKTSPHSIRKVKKVIGQDFFEEAFMEATEETALYFGATHGATLRALTPQSVLEDTARGETILHKNSKKISEKYVLQADTEERFATYRSLIREQFSKKMSVFVCVPTIQEMQHIREVLEKGIEQYTFSFHTSLPKKQLMEAWQKAKELEHPILVVGTVPFLGIRRADIATIIIEKENSRAYKMQTRPYLDMRFFAEKLAEKKEIRLIRGDTLLQTETIWKYKNGNYTELAPLKWRSLSKSNQLIVDMRKDQVIKKSEKFSVLSDELKSLIREVRENNEHLFIFSVRRGLSPTTVCRDCGSIVVCGNCTAPIVLHSKSSGNFFLCHRCGERRTAEERCVHCESWRLQTLGIGIERVLEEIKKECGEMKLFRIDKDTVENNKKGNQIAKEFLSSPGSILIGTEMALSYLHNPVTASAVISIDSLFSIPDFKMNERVMNILLQIRSLTSKKFLIQTRKINASVIENAMQGNLIDFSRNEIKEREEFGYPPFSVFIKITISGKKEKIVYEIDELKKTLLPHDLYIFPAFVGRVKKEAVLHGLLKVERNVWPDKKLSRLLASLPLKYTVVVDPESLL